MRSRILDWRFLFLAILVIIIQFSLLSIILQNGFTADDWLSLFNYKIYGAGLGFIEKYFITLKAAGFYHTYQITYVGILEDLFKGNYQAYQLASLVLKSLATISLYPLLLAVFKRKRLAFLTTILYAVSYSSAGALLFICTGSDYLAIFFMNIFFLSYYYYFLTQRKLLLLLSVVLLLLSFISSPIRMYPLLGVVLFVEIFVWIKSREKLNLVPPITRLILLFSPFLITYLLAPKLTGGQLHSIYSIVSLLSFGNYQLLLSPFGGIGYTILTNDYWTLIFGNANFSNFLSFVLFLLKGPFIIYSLLAIAIGFLISKKPFIYILGIIFSNILFEVVSFFLITHLKGIDGPNVKPFFLGSIYAIFVGFFVFTISVSSFIAWLKANKSNSILLPFAIGPIFSSIFFWGIWLIKGDVLNFKEGIHWYMTIAAIGSSLFLGALIILAFDRVKLILRFPLKLIFGAFLFMILPFIYSTSNQEIRQTFSALINIGSRASDHEKMKNELFSNMKKPLSENPTLFYFDIPTDQIYFPMYFLFGFEEDMHFENWNLADGCIGIIIDKNKLKKSIVIQENIKGFYTNSLCVEDSVAASRQEVFYRPENLLAFRLKGKELIDIKQEILKQVKF